MQRRRCSSRTVLGFTPFLCAALIACGGGDSPTEPLGPSARDLSVPAANVTEVVGRLYDVLAAGQRADSGIAEILTPLMFILRAGVDDAIIRELGDAGQPVVTDVQIHGIADAFAADQRFGLNSFFTALSQDLGATTSLSGPLTRAYVTEKLAFLVGKTEYTGLEIVPALVLALGQERARRSPAGVTDAVWGDEWLDPLQLQLLMYAFYFAGGGGSTPRALTSSVGEIANASQGAGRTAFATIGQGKWWGRLGDWLVKKGLDYEQEKLKDIPKDFFEGIVEDLAELPITKDQATKAAICASILMYSYKFEMEVDPTLIFRRRTDEPDKPWQSTVDALLRFDLSPNANGLFALLGCGEMPAPGPAPNKPVIWVMTEELPNHGDLSQADSHTNVDGRARAIYLAANELVPPALRSGLTVDETGTINATASGLVPDWSALEAAVGLGMYNPTEEGVRIFVRHYRLPPNLILRVNSRFTREIFLGPGFESFEGVQVISDIPLTLTGSNYVGEGPLPFGGSGYEYRPILPPCYVFTQATAPGPVRATAVLRPGNALDDFALTLGQAQAGTDGSGIMSPSTAAGCPPGEPVTVPLPNPFFGFWNTFHFGSGELRGWDAGGGQPFATLFETRIIRDANTGTDMSENTTLELYFPATQTLRATPIKK